MILLALAALLTINGAAAYLPQLILLVRTRSAAGLSVSGQVVGSVSFVAWCAYLGATGSWALFGSCAIGAAIWITCTVLALRLLPNRRSGWFLPVAWTVGLGACWLVGGWTTTGAVLAFSVVLAHVPCVRDAWRSHDVSGISVSAWVLAGLDGAGWVAYGLIAGDPVVALYGVLAVPGPLAILARVAVTARLSAPRVPLPTRARSLTSRMRIP